MSDDNPTIAEVAPKLNGPILDLCAYAERWAIDQLRDVRELERLKSKSVRIQEKRDAALLVMQLVQVLRTLSDLSRMFPPDEPFECPHYEKSNFGDPNRVTQCTQCGKLFP